MWFEMWSNNSNIPIIIIYLYTAHFQSFRFLACGRFKQGDTGDQQRTHKKFKTVYCNSGFCLVMTICD